VVSPGSGSELHVAFCGDADVEVGLFAAARSLLNHSSRPVTLHILTDLRSGISRQRFTAAFGKRAEIRHYDVDTRLFEGWCPLVGNRFAYSKLLIPDLIGADRILYLDTDTITDTDVWELWNTPMAQAPLAAVKEARIGDSIEGRFLIGTGVAADANYYNAGVLLFNAAAWRRQGLTERALRFAASHAESLRTADQTVFNALLWRDILELDPRFNVRLWPTSDLSGIERGRSILHFSGGLKPWDPLSSRLHSGFPVWSAYHDEDHAARMSAPRRAVRCARLWRYYWTAIKARWT